MVLEVTGTQCLLIGKKAGMHLPETVLLTGAPSGLMRFESLWVDRLDGKVSENIPELAGPDVVPFKLWERVSDMTSTEGTLVVGEFDQRYRRVLVTQERGSINGEKRVLGLSRPSSLSSSQKTSELLQFFANRRLSLFERFHFLPQELYLLIGLGQGGRGGKEAHSDEET